MTATVVFARKEAIEILRTWRIVVLPSIMLVLAVTGPLLARYTPELITAVAGRAATSITLPPPTVFDSYGQWIKNLSQVVTVTLVIIYGGIVSSERRSGTAVLVLTKPVSRVSFVVTKTMVNAVYLALLLGLGTLVTWLVTALVFTDAPGGPLWMSVLVWLVFGFVMLSLMTLFSVLIGSGAGASGAGLAAFVVLSVAGLWKPLADVSPAGLLGRANALAGGTPTGSVLWPILTAFMLCIVAVALAAAVFRRREL